MADNQTSDLAQAIQDVSEKASLLVREEIELAKAEMTEKVTKLIKGAVVGITAGIFAVFGLIYLLHALAWLLYKLISSDGESVWIGYIIVAVLLFAFGGLAAWLALRFIKRGTPPAPVMAIDEAKLIKETVISSRPATPIGPAGTVASPTATPGGRS
jgi:uncharacterized membrane protein YqjE